MRLTISIPKLRWDSSDPDRAPPPLPLNPGSSSPAAKPNTSASIAAAAEAFVAKARESAYTINPSPTKSPERSLIKGQYHKRMQSLQNTNAPNLRDRSSYFDGTSSVERSPEKIPRTPALDYDTKYLEKGPTRTVTPTPSTKDFAKDTPSLRPASRTPFKAILGENTPPPPTMLALQNTPSSKDTDTSFSNVTINPNAISRNPLTFDAISDQILSLTNIATNLQREMTQLSRRSKDNATDLNSLKEATNLRDEDIRRNLRDLVSSLSSSPRMIEPGSSNDVQSTNHYGRGQGSFMIDSKPHVSPSGMSKSFSLPRIPSPNSFSASLDREIASSSINMEGAASIALLEKVLREMGTKEGQERLFKLLSELHGQPNVKDSDGPVAKKLEEILDFLKESSGSRALVTQRNLVSGAGQRKAKELEVDSRQMALAQTAQEGHLGPSANRNVDERSLQLQPGAGAGVVGEDIVKTLKKMKESVTEGGGMTAELKALVRELRGEVLGMGREIGRKLDEAETLQREYTSRDSPPTPGREEISQIVEQGLTELREHMENVVRESWHQTSSALSRNALNSQQVYAVVKGALDEVPFQELAMQNNGSGIEREEILEAVREAWESYKPEIELQNFGLERDEILQCLKEGLQQYQPNKQSKEPTGASYEEVLDAVHEGLKHFKPPVTIVPEPSITKEEILVTVRECLDTFDFPTSSVGTTRELEVTREDVLDAVREGVSMQAPISKELEFNRNDLFDAVRAGLEETHPQTEGIGEQVMEKMQDLIDGMRVEFKQYSAANGGDTEQVLDALKDGLEILRSDIESYVDRAADVTGKDEIIETLKSELEHLRVDLESAIGNSVRDPGRSDNGEMLDAMEKEFEHLRQTIATTMLRSGSPSAGGEREDILDTIRDGFTDLKQNALRVSHLDGNSEAIHAMKEEFEHLRLTIASSILRVGDSTVNGGKEEVLDVLRDGFADVKANTLRISDLDGNAEAIVAMKGEFEHLREVLSTALVRSGASTDKEEMTEILREGLEGIRADIARGQDKPESIISNTGEILDAFNDGIDGLRADLEKMINKPLDMTVNYEILETLKDGLANIKLDIERLQSAESAVTQAKGGEVVIADGEAEKLRRNDIENLEVMIAQLKVKVDALDDISSHPPPAPPTPQPAATFPESIAVKEDLEGIEVSLKDLHATIESLAEREQTQREDIVTKEDTEALETLLRNTKAKIDDLSSAESDGLARVAQIEAIEAIIKETRDAVDTMTSEKASKDDLGLIEALLQEVRAGVEEIREKSLNSDETDRATRSDIEILGVLCADTKTRVEELQLPDIETLPTRGELQALGDLIQSFEEKRGEEAELTARAFDARKTEHGGIADKIEGVKLFIDDVRAELKAKLNEESHNVRELAKTLETFTETVVGTDAIPTVNELKETVTREFESMHGNFSGSELDSEQKHNVMLEKHIEHRTAIIAELNQKIDDRFDELMTKYNDAQLVGEESEKALRDQGVEQTAALKATKDITEDLRILVDTLSSTVTESCDRMGEDSKTVFGRIEDIGTKIDGLTPTNEVNEHQTTRAEISKALTGVEGIQAHVSEYNPRILEAIKDILNIVGQHHHQATTSMEEIKTSVNAIPAAMPLPAITAPPSPPSLPQEIPVYEKYDDTAVHTKLDQLVDHAGDTSRSLAHLSLLDQISEQVTATATEFNDFVSSQRAQVAKAADDQAKAAEESAIALQMRISQREAVETDISRMCDQKQELADEVAALLRDKEDLAAQKSKMQADLSSLQMALQIRREELQIMETRAESLERRILDGVLDHSRSLLTTSRPQSSLKAMNLKRVVSSATNTTSSARASTVGPSAPSYPIAAVSSGIGMALKRRQPPKAARLDAIGNKGDRRILSLSTLGGNKGANPERSMVLANPSATNKADAFGFGGIKRSHSVKSNFPTRKTSWGGTRAMEMYTDEGIDDGDDDKENSVLDEEDEDHIDSSEAATERRTSYSSTYPQTCVSYGDTGSMVSADERRTSYAASTSGTVGTFRGNEETEEDESTFEEDTEEDKSWDGDHHDGEDVDDGGALAAKGAISNAGEMVVFNLQGGSDSGIGTDVPTAALEAGAVSREDYFRDG